MLPTTPTISAGPSSDLTRRPMALSSGKNRRWMASLMITTGRRVRRVGVVEHPARDERNLQRPEVAAGRHLPSDFGRPLAGRDGLLDTLERHRPVVAGQRHDDGRADITNVRERTQRGRRTVMKPHASESASLYRSAGTAMPIVMTWSARNPGIDREQSDEAAQNQAGADEQHDCERDLHHDERRCRATGGSAHRDAAWRRRARPTRFPS